MIRKEEVFKIGQFSKPHGVKGEIGLITTSDVLEESADPFIVCEIDGILVPFHIEEFRYKGDTVVLLKLENIDSEEDVRAFVGREVFYPLDAVEGDDLIGEMTWDGFVGYQVVDEKQDYLGIITDVDQTTLNILLKIEHEGNEILVPAVDEIILFADHTKKSLTVSLPEGLLDI